MNGKLTVDQKARAVEIALAGESPLPYLKEIGMKNPSASWQYIKSVLKNTNPDRWAQLPERLPKNIETPEGGITRPVTINAEDVGALVVDDDMVVKIDKPKTVVYTLSEEIKPTMDVPEGLKPSTVGKTVSTHFTANPDFSQTHSIPPKKQSKTYEVTGIRTDYGEFYYDRKFKSIDWRTDGGDEVGMDPKLWIALAGELADILKALGVEE